jgi:hypothetical protein
LAGPETSALRLLARAVAAGRWERPFLLLGRGPARDAAAYAFAKAVLCGGRAEDAGEACNACGPCTRFARDLHPDLHRLLPEKGRATIGVEAVEELQARLSLRPVEGRAAAAVVPGAEALTPQAQNALLKTLEEPPPRTAFVLTAAAPRALLDTVRSRCATVRLPPLPDDGVRAEARRLGAPQEGAGIAAAAAGWDPALLEDAIEDGIVEAGAILSRAFAPARDRGDGTDAAAAWVRGKGGPLEGQRGRLRAALRVLLALHVPGDAPGLPGPLRAPYNGIPPGARRARLAALGEARERVERNVDPAGVLEGLSFAFRTADKGGQG